MPRRIVKLTLHITTSEVSKSIADGAIPRHVQLSSDGSRVTVWFEIDSAMERQRDRTIYVQAGEGDAPDRIGLEYVGTVVNEAVGAYHLWMTP